MKQQTKTTKGRKYSNLSLTFAIISLIVAAIPFGILGVIFGIMAVLNGDEQRGTRNIYLSVIFATISFIIGQIALQW